MSQIITPDAQTLDLTDPTKYRSDKRPRMIVSFDLGKRQDYTAYTISEVKPEMFTNLSGRRGEERFIDVLDVQRIELDTDYDVVAQAIHDLVHDKRLWLIDDGTQRPVLPTLLIDVGGVGDSTYDFIRKLHGIRGGITYVLTGGTAEVYKKGNRYSVPRTAMFNDLYAFVSNKRIRVNPRLKLAKALIEELRSLQPVMSEETGRVQIVHRSAESPHDDLAICAAATAWWALRPLKQPLRMVQNEATVRKLMGDR